MGQKHEINWQREFLQVQRFIVSQSGIWKAKFPNLTWTATEVHLTHAAFLGICQKSASHIMINRSPLQMEIHSRNRCITCKTQQCCFTARATSAIWACEYGNWCKENTAITQCRSHLWCNSPDFNWDTLVINLSHSIIRQTDQKEVSYCVD